MSLIGNERAKLSATYLNGIALIVFGIGGFAPAVAYLYSTVPPALPGFAIVIGTGVCAATSVGLHLAARRILGRLQ